MTDSTPTADGIRASRRLLPFLVAVLLLLCWGCGSKTPAPGQGGPGSSRPYTVRGVTYRPLTSAKGFVQTGMASWYGPSFHGRTTSSGERYDQNSLTAAHTVLPFQTMVRVTNLGNGRSVVVRVNDRGPFSRGRVIDLSRAAASRIGLIGPGTARVRLCALDEDGEARSAPMPPSSPADLYYVQVGAFKSRDNARRAQAWARRKGYGVKIFSGGRGLERVVLGPWRSLDEANRALWTIDDDYPQAFLVSGEQ